MAVETRTSSIDLKGEPGPFLARIVRHLDTTYMGGLEVEILKTTEEGNNAETTGQTAQVKYLPGFSSKAKERDEYLLHFFQKILRTF